MVVIRFLLLATQCLTATCLTATCLTATCLTATAPDADDLARQVTTIFGKRCVSCHSALDQAGGLSLESVDDLRDSGYLEAGESNPLLALLVSDATEPPAMPKDGHPLTDKEIAAIQQWLELGAHWPSDLQTTTIAAEDFQWWSLQPLISPSIPNREELGALPYRPETLADQHPLAATDWILNPIDAFVWQKLKQNGLGPNPPADRRALIRRLSYDLTGLPPSPEEVTRFIEDSHPQAYEQLVDRLLESPRFGERWGRHWLDLARYADTAGYDKDKLRPQAWPYRDYVIRSFNQDKPYRQFVQEQIAGDVLYPNSNDGIVGLGFLAAGPWDFIGHVEVPESKIDGMEARNLDRDEIVSATFNAFCSTTVQCARCHHHKFDPITLEQYYGLQAIFAAVDRANRPFDSDPQVAQHRFALNQELDTLRAERGAIQSDLAATGGAKLQTLRQQLEYLETPLKTHVPEVWPAEHGYHSQLADQENVEKWVELQFEEPQSISRIVVYPCHDDFAGIGAGFGFPNHIEVTVVQEPDADWTSVAEFHAHTDHRPVLQPYVFEFHDHAVLAERVRLTSRSLARRQDDWMFALAEIEVWNSQDVNIAPTAKLVALDSIEAPPRWMLQNLTDGLKPVYSLVVEPESSGDAATVREQLEALENTLLTPERRQRLSFLELRIEELQRELANLPAPQMVFAAATHFSPEGNFRPTLGVPRSVHVLHRGNVSQPLQPATPGTMALRPDDAFQFSDTRFASDEGARRAELAKWIVDPNNPLTWRSIVNRVWQWHFGRGIVDSPNDFGRMGQLPTHPELLEWLAHEFREHQSFKQLTRLIVTSATYRQSSVDDQQHALLDSENTYLWKFNRRRLSAEEVRDSMLMVSHSLDETMGGPGYFLFQLERVEHSPHFAYHKFDPENPETHRRSVYRFVVRSQPDPWMTTMDGADCSQSVAKRDETITPMQALSLMNNDLTLVMARKMAEHLRLQATELEQQVQRGFYTVTCRLPTAEEQAAMLHYADGHGLENLCRILLNLSELVFVD